MICCHLFERARRTLSIDWPNVTWAKHEGEARIFRRVDGSAGKGDYYVRCSSCDRKDPKQVDYVEEVFRHGKMHVADFLREAKPSCS
jgi:hypothetical protein